MAQEDNKDINKEVDSRWPEHKKRQMLWPIVIVLAALIFAFWAYNLQNVWQTNVDKSVDLGTVKKGINESLNELEQKLEENSRLKNDSSEMLNELIEEAKNSTSSDELVLPVIPVVPDATTTLDFPEDINIPQKINCPEWINCMPSIDEVRPCQIPVGCEGITQIAY